MNTKAFTGYGDITKVEATGASSNTAQQDKLRLSGVWASEAMAQTDSRRMNKYKSKIVSVGHQWGIDPALIAGIISRASRAGNALQCGWGDQQNCWGLMQICIIYHTKEGDWDSEEHIRQATRILVDCIKRIQSKFPSWSKEQQLKGGIAAYDAGDANIDSYEYVDTNTSGRDYSNDVISRAKWYKKNGF